MRLTTRRWWRGRCRCGHSSQCCHDRFRGTTRSHRDSSGSKERCLVPLEGTQSLYFLELGIRQTWQIQMVHASHAATLSAAQVMYMHEHGREEGWRRTRRRSISPLPRTNVDMAFNHGGYNLGGGVLCASMTVLTFTATLLTLPSAAGGEGASLPTGSHFVMPPGNPTADPAAVVIAGGARFTVLANALVRMEWKDAQGSWNDMQTMVVFNRRTPLPQFNHTPLPHQGEMRA